MNPRMPLWKRLLLTPLIETDDEARAVRSRWVWREELDVYGESYWTLSLLGVANGVRSALHRAPWSVTVGRP